MITEIWKENFKKNPIQLPIGVLPFCKLPFPYGSLWELPKWGLQRTLGLICILSFTSKVWNAFLSFFQWHVLASAKIMMTTRRTLLTGRTKHSPYLRPPTGAHEYPQEWVFFTAFSPFFLLWLYTCCFLSLLQRAAIVVFWVVYTILLHCNFEGNRKYFHNFLQKAKYVNEVLILKSLVLKMKK